VNEAGGKSTARAHCPFKLIDALHKLISVCRKPMKPPEGRAFTHSLTAVRNRWWVVAPSMLTGIGECPCVSSSESGVPHDLTNACSPWSTGWTIPIMVWCVSRPGIHDELNVRLTRVKCHWMKASGTAHARALKRNVRLSLVRLTEANVPSFSCRRNRTAADVCA